MRVLGPFEVTADASAGHDVPGGDGRRAGPAAALITGRPAQTLFAYLLLGRDQAQPREALASALWGDRVTSRSRKALRQALWQLQQALQHAGHPQLLTADEHMVLLRSSPDLRADLDEVEQAARALNDHPAARLPPALHGRIDRAQMLSRQELLTGWPDEWCAWPREGVRALHLEFLERLLKHHQAGDQPRQVLAVCAAILRVDPAHEVAHRAAMGAHHALGNRPAALRQFQRCRQTLRDELQAEPEAATLQLGDELRQTGRPLAPTSPSRVSRAPAAPPPSLPPDVLRALVETLGEVRGMLERCRQLLEAGPPRDPSGPGGRHS